MACCPARMATRRIEAGMASVPRTTNTRDYITDTIATVRTTSTSCWTATKRSWICSALAAIQRVCRRRPTITTTTTPTFTTWRRLPADRFRCRTIPRRRRRRRRPTASRRFGRWQTWPEANLVIKRWRQRRLQQPQHHPITPQRRQRSSSNNSSNNKRLQRPPWLPLPSSRYLSARCRRPSVSGRRTAASCRPTTTTTAQHQVK